MNFNIWYSSATVEVRQNGFCSPSESCVHIKFLESNFTFNLIKIITAICRYQKVLLSPNYVSDEKQKTFMLLICQTFCFYSRILLRIMAYFDNLTLLSWILLTLILFFLLLFWFTLSILAYPYIRIVRKIDGLTKFPYLRIK